MGKLEIFFSNFCSPHPIKAFTIRVHKPVAKEGEMYNILPAAGTNKTLKINKKLRANADL